MCNFGLIVLVVNLLTCREKLLIYYLSLTLKFASLKSNMEAFMCSPNNIKIIYALYTSSTSCSNFFFKKNVFLKMLDKQ